MTIPKSEDQFWAKEDDSNLDRRDIKKGVILGEGGPEEAGRHQANPAPGFDYEEEFIPDCSVRSLTGICLELGLTLMESGCVRPKPHTIFSSEWSQDPVT